MQMKICLLLPLSNLPECRWPFSSIGWVSQRWWRFGRVWAWKWWVNSESSVFFFSSENYCRLTQSDAVSVFSLVQNTWLPFRSLYAALTGQTCCFQPLLLLLFFKQQASRVFSIAVHQVLSHVLLSGICPAVAPIFCPSFNKVGQFHCGNAACSAQHTAVGWQAQRQGPISVNSGSWCNLTPGQAVEVKGCVF